MCYSGQLGGITYDLGLSTFGVGGLCNARVN